MKTEIEVGDIVSVNFNNSQYTLMSWGEVLYIPASTGDSWRFRDMSDQKIHYVSEGCTISLIEKRT